MNVYFASDHAGFALKQKLMPYVESLGCHVFDLGPSAFVEGDDYPDYIIPLARKVAGEPESFGIAIGASGQGEAMACNRVPGVRAAIYYGEAMQAQSDAEGNILNLMQSARAHNNANILSIGARFISDDDAMQAVKTFLETPFSGDARHARRIAKLDA